MRNEELRETLTRFGFVITTFYNSAHIFLWALHLFYYF